MSLSITEAYHKSLYETTLENAINTQLSNLSANVSALSGNITTLSADITTLMSDTTAVSASTAIFTLDLTTYRNFVVTNTETSAKTLKIASVPTSSDTMLDLAVKMIFSATATVTYTGTITWSQAAAPNPTAVGTFILSLKSFDAGANWLASYTGLY